MAQRNGLILLALAAFVALAAGLYAYFAPLTGVQGVWGPLLASFGALCILIGAALTMGVSSSGLRGTLFVLLALALLGTGFAALLLHQWIMVGAIAVGILAWLIAAFAPKGASA